MGPGSRVEGRTELVGDALTALQNIETLFDALGVKTLTGATNGASTNNVTNNYATSFLLTKLIVREVSTIDANVTLSLGVTGTPGQYLNAVVLTPADFTGGNTVSFNSFSSGVPVANASDFLITAAAPITTGALEYTLIGVLQ